VKLGNCREEVSVVTDKSPKSQKYEVMGERGLRELSLKFTVVPRHSEYLSLRIAKTSSEPRIL
jgi:hypothetical protein